MELLLLITVLIIIILLYNCQTREYFSPGTGIQIQSKLEMDYGLIGGQTRKFVHPWFEGSFYGPNGEVYPGYDHYNPYINFNYQ
jgi:hypothetical protein